MQRFEYSIQVIRLRNTILNPGSTTATGTGNYYGFLFHNLSLVPYHRFDYSNINHTENSKKLYYPIIFFRIFM